MRVAFAAGAVVTVILMLRDSMVSNWSTVAQKAAGRFGPVGRTEEAEEAELPVRLGSGQARGAVESCETSASLPGGRPQILALAAADQEEPGTSSSQVGPGAAALSMASAANPASQSAEPVPHLAEAAAARAEDSAAAPQGTEDPLVAVLVEDS